MVFGELVPKNLAIAEPLRTARAVAGPQAAVLELFTPADQLTNGTANWILRRLGIEPAEELRSARSPQELVSLVRNSARRGAPWTRHRHPVDRSLQFGDRTAEELMTPRSKIEALQADDTVADLVATARRPASPASRSSRATSTRRSASCTSNRSSRCRPRAADHPAGRARQPVPRCRRRSTATR